MIYLSNMKQTYPSNIYIWGNYQITFVPYIDNKSEEFENHHNKYPQ